MKQWTLALILTASAGCTAIVNDAIRDPADGGMTSADCTGASDGDPCGEGQVCIDEVCSASECGDDATDDRTEDCDDGNDVEGDGCEPDCTFTCETDEDCDDGLDCTGTETCSDESTCVEGTPLASGETCTQTDGSDGVCRGTDCVAAGCGNTLMDSGEECDDGNVVDGDGCDSDCTFTCTIDADCDDASVCTGVESCDLTSHTCVPGEAMTCDDGSPCTSNDCDPVMGCVFPLIDADGDGHASNTLGACGDDCNDMRDDVSPSAVELCGDALDSDCNGDVNPASTPFWYLDCDNDGYAVSTTPSQQSCTEPAPATGCAGGWTTRVPSSSTTRDCNDNNANVHPGQTTYFSTAISGVSTAVDYDYNCDSTETKRYTLTRVSTTASCREFLFGCSGESGWTGPSTEAPACGVSASASLCIVSRGVCTRVNYSSYAQSCR